MNRTFVEAAAFASAIAPEFVLSGVQESEQFEQAGDHEGLQTIVIVDASGRMYDTTLADGDDAIALLTQRARAAVDLKEIKETAALRFSIGKLRHFNTVLSPTTNQPTAVLISRHFDGSVPPMADLSEKQCGALGAAIASIHRLPSASIREKGYPVSTAADLSGTLPAWITSLSRNQQIPSEILNSWSMIIADPKLFDYTPVLVHGGYVAGDVLFSQSNGVEQIRHWERMKIDDPASDLAWTWRLNSNKRDAVMAAYARLVPNMDELIMIRARLWLQMEAVVKFLQALNGGSDAEVVRLKADLDRLASEIVQENEDSPDKMASIYHPGTMTLSNFLSSDRIEKAPRKWIRDALGPAEENAPAYSAPAPVVDATETQAIAMPAPSTVPPEAIPPTVPPAPHETAQRFHLPDLSTTGLGLSGQRPVSSNMWAHDNSKLMAPIGGTSFTGFDPTRAAESAESDDGTRQTTIPAGGFQRGVIDSDDLFVDKPQPTETATSTELLPLQAGYLPEDDPGDQPRVIPPLRRLDTTSPGENVAADDTD